MGLDTTHDCWHGAYSAFMRWRTAVAKAAGIPLLLMDGFHRCPEPLAMEWAEKQKGETYWATALHRWCKEVDGLLPLSWDLYKGDPIVTLLSHSDCDGHILPQDCGPLADRLDGLLPALEKMDRDEDSGGHVARGGGYAGCARTFVAGLRHASSLCERVEFH